jgi:hypothetical protein
MFAIADQADAALVFGTAGVAALAVATITRYSARPA